MRASRNAGFTLLEVLAALVIISLGMLGVIEAISQTASNSTRMRDRALAHWVAMNRLTEVRLQTRAPKIDKTSDEVEMAGRKWRWTMEVTETPVQSLRRIDIRVAEADADEDSSLTNVTGFYGTAVAPAGMNPPVWVAAPVQNLPPGTEQPGTEQPGTEQPGTGDTGDLDDQPEPTPSNDDDGPLPDPPPPESDPERIE
ncbi:MAG TPA: type II secretion system minor pseudopilin GspI [Steroidobacteraceae bacterium]|nr:type II secretion system minor pseudopilin GspI [Steroidobacteraceae bacterium]